MIFYKWHNVPHLTKFLCLSAALVLAYGCKTPRGASQASQSLSSDNGNNPQRFGLTLDDFRYEPDSSVLKELGARIGCDEAAKWVTLPSSGSMRQAISNLKTSNTPYQTIRKEFFNESFNNSKCKEGGSPSTKSITSGIKRLHEYVMSSSENTGLTIVMLGGFGSHIGGDSSLDASVDRWQSLIDAQDDGTLQVWQIECSNSFAPNDICAKEFVDTVAERERNFPAQAKNKYLLWGYSKGGLTALESLKQSRSLRNQTLAVVTNGSPIGGSMTILMLNPLIQKIASQVAGQTSQLESFASAQPWAALMTPAGYLLDGETASVKIAKLMQPDQLALVVRGADEMMPATRKNYLFNEFKEADFSRDSGTAIPVFHTSALADIATMRPWPRLTVKDDRLQFQMSTLNADHMAELAFAPMMKDYPLSDTCVALEHSVIPSSAAPDGLAPQFLSTMKFDHATFRYSPLVGSHWDVPHLEIVDSILETVASKMEKGEQNVR